MGDGSSFTGLIQIEYLETLQLSLAVLKYTCALGMSSRGAPLQL